MLASLDEFSRLAATAPQPFRLHRIYFDSAMEFGSPDPADPSLTTRVLTILLAEEY